MLSELKIKNFAIIQELELEFIPGLIVLTGETGAGKSIIMGALDMLLGYRVDMDNLRTGSEYASVEAVFQISEKVKSEVHAILEAEDLLDDLDCLLLTRELRKDKRNVARVNGHRTNVNILVKLGELLVDIHGQSDHLSLMDVKQHLDLLDRFCEVSALLSEYQVVYDRLVEIQSEIKRLEKLDEEAEQKQELLSFQVNEIKASNLEIGEDEVLIERRNRLANSEKLAELTQRALVLLDEAPPDQPTVSDLFGQVVDDVNQLVAIDPAFEDISERTNEVVQGVSDVSHKLRLYLEDLEFQPDELEEVEERLNLIRTLKRKYGETIEEVLAHAEKAADELEDISDRSEKIKSLQQAEGRVLQELSGLGQKLTQKRKKGAEKLTFRLERELADLKMAGARFRVDFQQVPDPRGLSTDDGRTIRFSRLGMESVEFMIETNLGEGLKPLAKVASGGETARLMLAIKSVLADADQIASLVFDEIDQGIGGRIGSVVGEKLSRLADQHQVFCITHLPQLASYGEQHLQVMKEVSGDRTRIRVQEVSRQEREKELAQMLGGISENNLRTARELLIAARNPD